MVRLLVGNTWLDAPDRMLGLHKIVTFVLDLPLFVTGPFTMAGKRTFTGWLFVWTLAQWLADCYRTALHDAGYVKEKAEVYVDVA